MSNQKKKQAAIESARQQVLERYEAEIQATADVIEINNRRDEVIEKRKKAEAEADADLAKLDAEDGALILSLREEKGFSAQQVQTITGHTAHAQKRLMDLAAGESATSADASDDSSDVPADSPAAENV